MAVTENYTSSGLGAWIQSAGTGTTVSSAYDISMREKVTFQFISTGVVSGNGVFTVEGSIDGTNWVAALALQDVTSTNSTTYITSITLNANTTKAVLFPAVPFRFLRVRLVGTTDGSYTAIVQTYGE